MSLVSVLMYLLSMFIPADAMDYDQVYAILNDTELAQVMVDEDSLASVAAPGISTLTVDSDVTLIRQVLGSVGDVGSSTINGRLYRLSDYTSGIYSVIQNLYNGLGYSSSSASLAKDFDTVIDSLGSTYNGNIAKQFGFTGLSSLQSYLDAMLTTLNSSNPDGKGLATEDTLKLFSSVFDGSSSPFVVSLIDDSSQVSGASFVTAFSNLTRGLVARASLSYLDPLGNIMPASVNIPLSELTMYSFSGLARVLMPYASASTGFYSLASYSITSESDGMLIAESKSATSLGALIAALGTQLQEDTASLRYVLASEEDIQMKEDAAANTKAAADNFVSSSGSASPSTSDIGDAAGISSDLTSTLDTGVSPTQAFAALNDADAWGFFTQEVQDQLNPFRASTVPAVMSADDDFVSAFDPHALEKYLANLGKGG